MRITNVLNRSRRGFTLVEILLVAVLMSMIGASLYQAISNGVKVWNRAHRFVIEEDIAIFMDKFRQDLRHSLEYSQLSWDAGKKELSFPALITTRADRKISGGETRYVPQIGMVRYSFDSVEHALIRETANYGQALKGKYGPERILARPVENLKFFYIYKEDDALKTEPGLRTGILPLAVVAEVTFLEDTGARRKIRQQVNLPLRDQKQNVF